MNETAQQRIEAYQAKAEEHQATAPDGPCPRCCSPTPRYQVKEQRERRLGLIEGYWVHWFSIVLSRWTCLVCGKSCTWYPPFCLPYKRYVVDDMIKLGQSYLRDVAATYRSVTRGVGYEVTDQQLSPTTVWRWCGVFGRCEHVVQVGLRLLQDQQPELDLHRSIRPVGWRKYRSEGRRCLLEQAQYYVQVATIFFHTFSKPLVPQLRNTEP